MICRFYCLTQESQKLVSHTCLSRCWMVYLFPIPLLKTRLFFTLQYWAAHPTQTCKLNFIAPGIESLSSVQNK